MEECKRGSTTNTPQESRETLTKIAAPNGLAYRRLQEQEQAHAGDPAGGVGRGDGDGGEDARHHHQLSGEAGQGPHSTRYRVFVA